MYDSSTDALRACIDALGGAKAVGKYIWPAKSEDAATRLLLDCLNEDRPAHLTPDQAVFVFRLARDRVGCHAGMSYLTRALGYAPTVPVEPQDARAELQRQFIEASKAMAKLVERIEAADSPFPTLRSAA